MTAWNVILALSAVVIIGPMALFAVAFLARVAQVFAKSVMIAVVTILRGGESWQR